MKKTSFFWLLAGVCIQLSGMEIALLKLDVHRELNKKIYAAMSPQELGAYRKYGTDGFCAACMELSQEEVAHVIKMRYLCSQINVDYKLQKVTADLSVNISEYGPVIACYLLATQQYEWLYTWGDKGLDMSQIAQHPLHDKFVSFKMGVLLVCVAEGKRTDANAERLRAMIKAAKDLDKSSDESSVL